MIEVTLGMVYSILEWAENDNAGRSELNGAIRRIIELHEQSKPKPEPVGYIYKHRLEQMLNSEVDNDCNFFPIKDEISRVIFNRNRDKYLALYTTPPTQALQHSDDLAVDQFAQALKDKMRKSREKGRSGWDDKQQCPNGRLQQMLIDHLGKGDPLDVGAFAMMLFIRSERTNPPTREPLSKEALGSLWEMYGMEDNSIPFARAIEKAHGIGVK